MKHSYKELLASTAVFAEMANSNVDLKQVLTEFTLSTYSLEQTFSQTVNEVSDALRTHFEFEIPVAVVKTILKKLKKLDLLSQENGRFVISPEERNKWERFVKKVEKKQLEQKKITDQLISYVELHKGKLEDEQRTNLLSCFYKYLFDESFENEYYDVLSAFIIKKSTVESIHNELNLIREGTTILNGIKYNPNVSEVKPWRKPLNIYLDTEHLFNISGYNGEIYYRLMSDLVELVDEINKQNKEKFNKKSIQFKYFEDTELEVKNFFYAAQRIISGDKNRGFNSVAMNEILNGSKTVADIINKESDFFMNLSSLGLRLEKNFSLYENHSYNVEDQYIYDKYSPNSSEEEINSILKSFTAINILRKGNNNQDFENIGHIIMTGSNIKLQISSDIDIKINNTDFSFATNIYYITNHLWFRLNKGLGFKSSLPSSLDVVAKAQMLLSSHLNHSVREHYNKLEQDYISGNKSIESIKGYYLSLRSFVVKPEDLVPDNIEEKIKILYDYSDIERFQEEQSLLRKKALAYDELQANKLKEDELNIKLAREELINTCCLLLVSARKNFLITKIFIYALMTSFAILGIWGIISIITKHDTPLSIFSAMLAIISVLSLIKIKKLFQWISLIIFQKYERFKKTNLITNAELGNINNSIGISQTLPLSPE
ncbi:hypothetical protein [Catalinimonas alkaloidigena]|uniref:hypothetical protein n=1 Tax=Catalinimonas alkaloidigena TaxID=1075417 RepID=UPI00115FAA5B|nr:hypothetical protein [Catalinimonas alkaloidigena]